jgi:SH3-like domain-containing protein
MTDFIIEQDTIRQLKHRHQHAEWLGARAVKSARRAATRASGSQGAHAAIDDKFAAQAESRIFARQEQGRQCDFSGLTLAVQGG